MIKQLLGKSDERRIAETLTKVYFENSGFEAEALEEKLKVNMARQWPEPKDGEPRLHIKP